MRPVRRTPLRSAAVRLVPVALATLCVALPATAPAQDAPDDTVPATVEKLKVRLGRKSDRCALRVRLPLDGALDTLDPRLDDVAIDLDGVRVFELPAPPDRTRLRERKPLLWVHREGRRGARFALDLAHRTVKLRIPRGDLDGLAEDAVANGLRVSVTLGDRVFEEVVDVTGSARRLVLAPRPPVVGDPGGGDPGIGDPVPVTARVLALHGMSGISRAQNAVARSDAELAALWDAHQSNVFPQAPRPRVDFATEMVVAVLLGDRPSPAHSIELRQVVSDGRTTTVRTTDARVTSGDCAFATVIVQPSLFLAVPRTDAVTFESRVEQRACR